MGQGKAQESSSEAVNAYYSAYLLSLALGDVELAHNTRVASRAFSKWWTSRTRERGKRETRSRVKRMLAIRVLARRC